VSSKRLSCHKQRFRGSPLSRATPIEPLRTARVDPLLHDVATHFKNKRRYRDLNIILPTKFDFSGRLQTWGVRSSVSSSGGSEKRQADRT
jgi:hypothetical protein